MSSSSVAEEAIAVHRGPSDAQIVRVGETTNSIELKNVDYSLERKNSLRARYAYGIIFLVMNLVAWFFRDYGKRFIPQFHCK